MKASRCSMVVMARTSSDKTKNATGTEGPRAEVTDARRMQGVARLQAPVRGRRGKKKAAKKKVAKKDREESAKTKTKKENQEKDEEEVE